MSKSLRLADEWEHRSYEIAAELRRLDALVKEQAQMLEERDREIEELQKANQDFAQRQDWWNDRMFDLEQEIERLKAQRVPAHGAGAGGRLADGCCHKTVLKPCDGCPYAIEAAHGIHPLQRLSNLSKESVKRHD